MKSDKALFVILTTVALDAAGIGLIMPVLPGLLRTLAGADQVARHYGVLLALYALMQFLCAPLLGALSDRHGRRPVLLASLAGAAVDYAVMAVAPALWVLYLGRAVAGLTGATGAVASSCIADLSRGEDRARRYGYLSACMGLGLIAGPVIGGLAGQWSPHAPFAVAAALNALNCLMAWRFLPESRPASDATTSAATAPAAAGIRAARALQALNPLGALRWVRGLPAVPALLLAYVLAQISGQVPGSLWVLYGEDRYHWDAAMVGLSLAAFGVLHALAQALLPGPATRRFGERGSAMLGLLADGCAYVLIAFATQGWMAFPILLPLALGGLVVPALQALLSQQAGASRQGQLQGSLASLAGLTSVIGPLCVTALYAAPGQGWNGWPWLAGAALNLAGLALLLRRAKPARDLCAGNGPATARQRQ